jgi:putative transcriptional regulator
VESGDVTRLQTALATVATIALTALTAFPPPVQAGPDADSRDATHTLQVAAPPPSQPEPPEAPTPSARPNALAPARFLIATRQLSGPFFTRSVVLLLDYSPAGALGVIINRPTDVALNDLIPALNEIGKRPDTVYLGGPVSPRSVVFLIRSDSEPPDSQHVIADVHATGSTDALRQVVRDNAPASRFHAYVGYAGWAPAQLDAEVARGDWYIEEATPDPIFTLDTADLWNRLVTPHEGIQVNNPDPSHPATLAANN